MVNISHPCSRDGKSGELLGKQFSLCVIYSPFWCVSASNGRYQVEGSGGDGFLPCVWVSECQHRKKGWGKCHTPVLYCTDDMHWWLFRLLPAVPPPPLLPSLSWFLLLSLCSTMFAVFFFLNLILWVKGSSAAIPFGTLVALLALW